MEDRYLFKAKRLDNGEWVVGTLLHKSSSFSIECDEYYIFDGIETSSNDDLYLVDPSTICQCTGLKDKNGNLIWENDVVKATVRQSSLCQSSSYSDFYQISYQEKYCYFYLKKKNNNLLFDGNWSYYLKSIEVIGNIFDNPELLESEG